MLENHAQRIQHSLMQGGLKISIWLLLLPTVLSGCCTYLTIDSATHSFRHDSVTRIEKAVVAQDDKLVALVDGTRAESSKVRQFTMTVSLPPEVDGTWVPPEGMHEGWRMPEGGVTQTMPVTIGPSVVLPAYQSALGSKEKFPSIAEAERTLYLVQHSKPDAQTSFFYTSQGSHPRTIQIGFDGREVKTPQRYPLLLLVPLTVAADVATFPFQIYWLSTLGDKPGNLSPMPIPSS